MDRDTAIRIDGMLINSIGTLDGIAHYLKNNLSDDEYKKYIYIVGNAMGNLSDFSAMLHKLFDDITPKELRQQI
ncbi:MAG TPA: hypothetical protein VN715_02670 [Roseiarcus sp.]|nr:hypothetical protein [Roseiarcus sp.]